MPINIDDERGGYSPGDGGLFSNPFGMPTHIVKYPGDAGLRPNRGGPYALVDAWLAGHLTFEQLKERIPNEESRNRVLNESGYDPEGNLIDVVGEPEFPDQEIVYQPPPVEEYGKDLMTSYQDLVDEGKIVTGIPDYVAEGEPDGTSELPPWEEVWEKAKDAVTKNPKATAEILREILESMGVPIPGDIKDILQGGYGIILDERTGGIFSGDGIIFVPGVPIGGPPTSVEIGTIGGILAGEGGQAVKGTIQKVLSEVGVVFDQDGKPVDYDPTAILDVLIGTKVDDVPPSVLEAILTGSVTIGAVDWLKDLISGGAEQPTPTPTPPISGTADSGEEEPEPAGLSFGHEWSDEPLAGPETSPQVLNLNDYATIDPDLIGGGEVTRTGGESILSFGPEFGEDDTFDEPTQEVLTNSEDSGGGGVGGGGGGGAGTSEDFLRGLSYRPLQVPTVTARPVVDYTAGLFTQPTSRMGNLQLGGITAGLFGDMIG